MSYPKGGAERGEEWQLVFLLCLRLSGVVTKVHTHDSFTGVLDKQPFGFFRVLASPGPLH